MTRSLFGVKAEVMASVLLPPMVVVPDFQCGFKLHVPDLIDQAMIAIRKYVPFGDAILDKVFTILKKFGIVIPKPYIMITNLELEKFSVVKFLSGELSVLYVELFPPHAAKQHRSTATKHRLRVL